MFLFSVTLSFGQYLHLSNIVDNSISFNHAAAGINNGKSELGLVYRDQGNRIGNNNFRRLHVFGHTDLTNNVGIGFTFNNLMAGEGRSQFINAVLAVPYHLKIKGKRFKNISISPLLSYLQLTHRESGNFILEENLLGSPGSDVNFMNKQRAIQAGLSLHSVIDLNRINIQLSYEYLSKAQTNAGVLLHEIHKVRAGTCYYAIMKDLDLHTSLLYQKSANEHQFLILPAVNLHVHNHTIQSWNAGIGYRIGDAMVFMLGADIKNQFKVYLAYDYTTSGLAAINNGRGAIELGLSYRLQKVVKQKLIQPMLAYQKPTFPKRKHKLIPIKINIQPLSPINDRNNIVEEIETESRIIKGEMSFVLYHDVNKIGINSTSLKEQAELLSFVQSNIQQIDSIVITSYTDAKGSNNYNHDISYKRASELKSSMTLKGLPMDKIKWKGLGEINILNDCYDGVDCIDEKHNENRRTVVNIYLK